MISTKKLIEFARKWRKKIRMPTISLCRDVIDDSSRDSITRKGHFVVYSDDHERFMLPLKYLKKGIIIELFKMAEEEFGSPSNGPLKLPCDAGYLQYVISLIKQNYLSEDVEKALLTSIESGHCSLSTYIHQENQPWLICSI
ncbi:Auxin responsive SAUR protein [Corchorus olitorius]|uniref:Auxin responsive SAUR protein n=1 Tax=Corchorus olitorius TaxID=93759 RepID=A0A1R3JAX6_9ROSI|nr:Auxin responsive SAUR protein [Corchorus olitorius]